MRASLPRLITLLSRDAIPKHAQGRVIPALPRPSEQAPTPTLVELLIARKEQRERLLAAATATESGSMEGQGQGLGEEGKTAEPWPTNLRIEPVVKREQLSQIHRSVRMQVKEALKER